MKTTNLRSIALLVSAMALLTSCKTVVHEGGLQPVSPKVTLWAANAAHRAESLQPTLIWEDPSGTGGIYDVIIYSGVRKEQGGNSQSYYVPGKELYFREGVSGTSHKVETPLPPKTICVWAVRVRDGGTTGPWSKYSGGWGAAAKNKDVWWRFETPKE
jgi:hypothetical protein